LREITIKIKKGSKPFYYCKEFYEREVSSGLKGCIPGDWVLIKEENQKSQLRLLAIANPIVSKGAPIRIIKALSDSNEVNPEVVLKELCMTAIKKRKDFHHNQKGARLIFGDADNLPGVICDEYLNLIVLQINTAGMDRYRNFLRIFLEEYLNKKVYFLDNAEYRSAESLPSFSTDSLPEIEVEENGIKYKVPSRNIQKVGFYYDHRNNRLKMRDWLKQYKKECKNGVDLFSYVGAWGLNALSEGIQKMTFVDQGDFHDAIIENLKINDLEGRGVFVREDIFQWLKKTNETFDLVISDPPAFSKNQKNKAKALGGYERLHRGLVNIVKKGSLLAIGSCTHGISLQELDLTVKKAFQRSSFTLTLLDIGIQGNDHPLSHLEEGSSYIKFLCYRVL